MTNVLKQINDFFANPNWRIDKNTPDHINDHFNNTWGVNAPTKPDNTPIFHGGAIVGTRQDIIDGKIDPTDQSAWKP